MFGIFALLRKLGWFATVGGRLKAEPLPLICGAAVAMAVGYLQSIGVLFINVSFLLNQTLLDSLCTAYGVCMTLDQGIQFIASGVAFAIFTPMFQKFYVAESPKSKFLTEANATAGKLVGAVNAIPNVYAEYPENPKAGVQK